MRRVKKQEHEKLTSSNIAHVAELLSAEKPITKKEACEILNISYNTTRLTAIIDEWKTNKETQAKRRAEKRGKPLSKEEKATIISGFLDGDSLQDISDRVYRSLDTVKTVIDESGVPSRAVGEDKYKTAILPEQCISEAFKPGELVWSAKYHTSCEVIKELGEKYKEMYGVPCYRVWVTEPTEHNTLGGFFAATPAYDLGRLDHLSELGVKIWR